MFTPARPLSSVSARLLACVVLTQAGLFGQASAIRDWLSGGLTNVLSSTIDAAGDVYLTGFTPRSDLPTTPGALRPHAGASGCLVRECQESFAIKISSDGRRLLYATYIASDGDYAESISVDAAGNAYIAGSAASTGLPVTPGAYQRTPGAGFALALSADGSTLLAATYLSARPERIMVHSSGDVFLVGSQAGDAFSTTPGAFQREPQGETDAFVLRLDAALSTARYSTRLGGSKTDAAHALAVDPQGSAYVGGNTSSTLPGGLFPNTSSFVPGGSVFVTRLSPDGSQAIFSTVFFAGAVRDLALDDAGAIYVTGLTTNDVPYKPGDVWMPGRGMFAKLKPDGSDFLFAARMPEPNIASLNLHGLTIAAAGPLIWDTSYVQVPTTPDSPHPCTDGHGPRTFAFQLSSDGTQRVFGSYFDKLLAANTSFVWSFSSSPDRILDRTPIGPAPGPALTCVAHGATFFSQPVAPGELVSLFGPDIGPAEPAGLKLDASGKVDISLGGVSVYFNGVAAPLTYASRDQINAVVPFEMADWPATNVLVLKNGTPLAPIQMPIVAVNPAVFPVGTLLALVNQDGTLNSTANPAPRGSVVTLYLTGAGLLSPAAETGSLGTGATAIARRVSAYLYEPGFPGAGFPRSAPAETLYAGDAPGLVQGVAQINLRLPDSTGSRLEIFFANAETYTILYVTIATK